MLFTMRQTVCALHIFVLSSLTFPICAFAEDKPVVQPDPRVKSGATISLEFPDLPETLSKSKPVLLVRIPDNYDPKRRYPLFLWVNGAGGDPGVNTALVNPEDYICISMPLFPKPGAHTKIANSSAPLIFMRHADIEVLWPSWKTMLEKLETVVPNIRKRAGVAAGFSNGGHSLGIVLSHEESAKEFQRYFRTFVFAEGGSTLLTAKYISGRTLLILGGETSWGAKGAIPWDNGNGGAGIGRSCYTLLEDLCKNKVDAKLIIMKGFGHTFPPEYTPSAKEWIASKTGMGAKSSVKWKPADLDGELDKKDDSALAEYLGKQAFVVKSEKDKPILIYCMSDYEPEVKGGKKSKTDVSPTKMCTATDNFVFSFHPNSVGVPLATEFFNCFKLDVSEIDSNANCQFNKESAPAVILLKSDKTLGLVLKGAKIKEQILLDAMKKLISNDDLTKVSSQIASLTPLIVKLKKLQLEIDENVKTGKQLDKRKDKTSEKNVQLMKENEEKIADLNKQYDELKSKIMEDAAGNPPPAKQ